MDKIMTAVTEVYELVVLTTDPVWKLDRDEGGFEKTVELRVLVDLMETATRLKMDKKDYREISKYTNKKVKKGY